MPTLYGIYEQPLLVVLGLLFVSVWALVWRGIALWFAGKNQQKGWFVVMLILNTAGLLPIIYLIWFKPKQAKKEPVKQKELSKAKSTSVTKKIPEKKTIAKKTAKKK
jgi:hypothetical protein